MGAVRRKRVEAANTFTGRSLDITTRDPNHEDQFAGM